MIREKLKPWSQVKKSSDRIAALVGSCGEDEFMEILCIQVSSGVHLKELAKQYKFGWVALREWIEGDVVRLQKYESAKRAYADRLVHDALEEVRNGTVEEVALHRLRSETYLKVAGKYDRKQYGEKVDVDIGVRIDLGDAVRLGRERMMRVIEGESERLLVINE